MGRIQRWLSARRAPLVVWLVGIALAAPALTADFTADDHQHRLLLRDTPGFPGLESRPFDLFVFANGEPETVAKMVDAGVFPWWTDPHLRLAFWRPISSATHALDHALWPDNATAQLAHNLAWHALVLFLVWLVFRRFFDRSGPARWIAVLAFALYAFDDARGPVVGWIANRNSLVALALGLPALLAHDRWRRDGWAHGRWVGPLVFAVSLFAGESAIAVCAYLGAHALWLDKGTWRSRAIALAPYVAIVVVWRVAYAKLGYGVVGSGVYLDPGSDPIAFGAAAFSRIPFLVQSALALPWSDFASFYPVIGLATPMLVGVWIGLCGIALALARIVRRDPVARFWATGMVLAAVPIASTFPADRLLGFVSIGAMGLVAQLVAAAISDRTLLGEGRARRIFGLVLAVMLVIVNLVLAPPLLVGRSRSMVAVGRVLDRGEAGIPRDADIATKTVIAVNPPSDALAGYIQYTRASRGQPRPAHLVWFATAATEVSIERTDDRTLRIAPRNGLLHYEVDQMVRDPRTRPFTKGETYSVANITFEIVAETPDHRPLVMLARFAIPLDDPSLVWLRWAGTTYAPYSPPAIGTVDTLPAFDFLKLLEDH
ncbi:MAG: hypothetical protein ACKV2T_36975 [Kofleriaceae bacterium]